MAASDKVTRCDRIKLVCRWMITDGALGTMLYLVLAQVPVSFVMWFAANGGGVAWDALLPIWVLLDIYALPPLCLAILMIMVLPQFRLYIVGLFLVSAVGFLPAVSLISKYTKNGSVETARLVAPVYNPAIRQAVSTSKADYTTPQIHCHRHSLIIYGPGTSIDWAADEAVRQYDRTADPDWIVGVGDKPEIVVIVAKGDTTSTGGHFRSCLGANCVDAGGSYKTTWVVKFVDLSLSAIVKTETIDRRDSVSRGALMDSINRDSSTPPSPDQVIDLIKRVVTWQ
jgi:hypothetical protein